jgi:enterochelin esterase-like enzyme
MNRLRAGAVLSMNTQEETRMARGPAFIARVIARSRALGYAAVPESRGKRDLRIDLLRGFCVFVMIVDHVGGESSWLYVLTGGNHFFVSAAEGFVLLSGISMGMVHSSVIRRAGVRVMLGKVASRARFLYALTVALTLTFAAASAWLGTPWSAAATPASGATEFAIEVITFHRSYSLTDVLVLYTLLVLASGPVLWIMSRGGAAIVLTVSIAAWTLAQISLADVPRVWSIVDGGFPFSAWQLLFVIGLTIGYHRQRLAAYLRPARLVAIGLAAVLALVAVDAIATQLVAGWVGSDAQELLFDKNDARVGRIIALLAVASFLYALVTMAWKPMRRWIGWLLMPLGTRSLYAYGVQLFVVAFWSSELMAPVRLDRENALFQGAAVLMVWAACLGQSRLAGYLTRARVELRYLRESVRRDVRPATAGLALAMFAVSCGISSAGLPAASSTSSASLALTSAVPASTADSWTPAAVVTATDPGPGQVVQSTFYSSALKRTMTYIAYLPPGYDASANERYPTLYMLHGGSGFVTEWVDYGLLENADALIREGTIAPMIIVLPEGDQEYWVDHVVSAKTGANGEKWGTYTAHDVVAMIDSRYRTIADASARAIGGLSMGGHGAMQLALNFPGIWSIVGAHSPSLRVEGDAPSYLGYGTEFAARDPYALIGSKTAVARTLTWWIDTGTLDPWRTASQSISTELTAAGIANEFHVYEGDHSAAYWSAHVDDYLRFYAGAFAEAS